MATRAHSRRGPSMKRTVDCMSISVTTNHPQLVSRLRRVASVSLALSLLLFLGPALLPYPTGTATTDLHWAVYINDACRYVSSLLGTFAVVLIALLMTKHDKQADASGAERP